MGEIAGYSNITGDGIEHAVRFHPDGTLTDLGTLGGSNSSAFAIDNSGVLVGEASTTGNSAHRATRFNPDGTLDDLGSLGGIISTAYHINDSGEIVGSSQIEGNSVYRATRFHPDDTPTDLGTLGGTSSYAFGINNSGEIVGQSDITGDGAHHATRFNPDGTLTDLGTLGGTNSEARAINNLGQIVGRSGTEDAFTHGFLYSGGVMHDINDLILPGSGVSNVDIQGYGDAINDWGQIVGNGSVDGQSHAVLLNPVDPLTSTSGEGTVRNTKFVGGMAYDKFTATTNPEGLGTTVDFLAGTAGSGGSVSYAEGGYGLNRDVTVTFTGKDHAGLASDIVSVDGTFSDVIVLSLTYDPSLFGNDVALGWFDEDAGKWVLAVDGNIGGEKTFIEGAFDPESDFVLGYYGIDTTTHTVWAVINHNSDFAAIQTVPEPGAVALIGLGLATLLLRRRMRA